MWGHSCTNKSSKSADRAGLNFNSPIIALLGYFKPSHLKYYVLQYLFDIATRLYTSYFLMLFFSFIFSPLIYDIL